MRADGHQVPVRFLYLNRVQSLVLLSPISGGDCHPRLLLGLIPLNSPPDAPSGTGNTRDVLLLASESLTFYGAYKLCIKVERRETLHRDSVLIYLYSYFHHQHADGRTCYW